MAQKYILPTLSYWIAAIFLNGCETVVRGVPSSNSSSVTSSSQSQTSQNPATAADIIAGKEAWGTTGSKITGTMSNRGTFDATSTWLGAGYYGSTVAGSPATKAICNGTTVLGLAGTAYCNLASGAAREKTATQISQSEEVSTYSGSDLPSGYRDIPVVTKDDDGGDSTSPHTKLTRGVGVWNGAVPRVVCGMGIATIAGRIADCDSRHGTKPSWDATSGDGKISWDGAQSGNGLAAEGSWTLVNVYSSSLSNGSTCDSTCLEVWRDDQTGLLWSDRVGSPTSLTTNTGFFNWCVATGNMENVSVDCTNGASGYNTASISLCAESTGLTTPVGTHNTTSNSAGAAPGATWSNTGTGVRDAKAGMMKTANTDPAGGGKSPSIRWRLPNKWDYMQADNDGLRFVLPNIGTANTNIWTATVVSASRGDGIGYILPAGRFVDLGRTNVYAVRCVGR